jgi:hypothetical protein
MAFRISTEQHYTDCRMFYCYSKCHCADFCNTNCPYAKCLYAVLLCNVIMPSTFMLSVIIPSVVRPSVIVLSVVTPLMHKVLYASVRLNKEEIVFCVLFDSITSHFKEPNAIKSLQM